MGSNRNNPLEKGLSSLTKFLIKKVTFSQYISLKKTMYCMVFKESQPCDISLLCNPHQTLLWLILFTKIAKETKFLLEIYLIQQNVSCFIEAFHQIAPKKSHKFCKQNASIIHFKDHKPKFTLLITEELKKQEIHSNCE